MRGENLNDEVHNQDGQHVDDGGNGYTTRVPGWRDAEFLPSSPKPRPWWSRTVTRAVSRIKDYTAPAEPRAMPGWIPPTMVSLIVTLVVAFGGFMQWRGGVNKDLEKVEEVAALRREVAELKGRLHEMDNLFSDVQVLNAYEINLREKLLPLTIRYNVELPPAPTRQSRVRRNDDNRNQENEP